VSRYALFLSPVGSGTVALVEAIIDGSCYPNSSSRIMKVEKNRQHLSEILFDSIGLRTILKPPACFNETEKPIPQSSFRPSITAVVKTKESLAGMCLLLSLYV